LRVPWITEKELEARLTKLLGGLRDEEEIVRYYAASELGELGEAAKPAVRALQLALGDGCHSVRRAAAWALSRIDPEALNHHPAMKQGLIEKIIAFCTTLPLRWGRRRSFDPEEYLAEPLEKL
jgi:hypothetical protein